MFQILKNNYIDVFCYSRCSKAVKYFPIDYARNFVPDWWKKIPNRVYMNEDKSEEKRSNLLPTIKKCPGFIENYKRGFMIPLWEEIEFVIQDGGLETNSASRNPDTFGFHSSNQYGEFLDVRKWIHVKINSPWAIKTDKPLNFVYAQPHYNFQDLNSKLFIPTSHDEYYIQHATEVQAFINLERNRVINLKPGLPLVHKIPITEKKIKLHIEHNPQMYDDLKTEYADSYFEGLYYNVKKHIRKKGL